MPDCSSQRGAVPRLSHWTAVVVRTEEMPGPKPRNVTHPSPRVELFRYPVGTLPHRGE